MNADEPKLPDYRLSGSQIEELFDIMVSDGWSYLGGDPLDWVDLDHH